MGWASYSVCGEINDRTDLARLNPSGLGNFPDGSRRSRANVVVVA
jgi:hypothetical protein